MHVKGLILRQKNQTVKNAFCVCRKARKPANDLFFRSHLKMFCCWSLKGLLDIVIRKVPFLCSFGINSFLCSFGINSFLCSFGINSSLLLSGLGRPCNKLTQLTCSSFIEHAPLRALPLADYLRSYELLRELANRYVFRIGSARACVGFRVSSALRV